MNKKLRRLPDWIEDMRGAIKNIREDIKGLTKSQFLDDGKSQRAVAKSVSDIGEAAHRIMDLAPDIAQRNPEIWKHFVGVYRSRNILWCTTISLSMQQLSGIRSKITYQNWRLFSTPLFSIMMVPAGHSGERGKPLSLALHPTALPLPWAREKISCPRPDRCQARSPVGPGESPSWERACSRIPSFASKLAPTDAYCER